MDPKVWGKLLTHCWRGYGVDVKPFVIESPPGGSPENAQDGISRVQKVVAVEKWFCGSPGCFQGIRVYIGERSRSVELQGAHEGEGAPTPLGVPPYLVAASLLP